VVQEGVVVAQYVEDANVCGNDVVEVADFDLVDL
jgi:hypothetical protein